jgi:hypothetical protein
MVGNCHSIKGAILLFALTGASGLPLNVCAESVTVGDYACVAQRLVAQGKKGDHYANTVTPKPDHTTFSITIAPIPQRDPETYKESHKEAGAYMQSWYCETSFELTFSPRQDEPLRGDAPNSFRGLLYSTFWLPERFDFRKRHLRRRTMAHSAQLGTLIPVQVCRHACAIARIAVACGIQEDRR